MGVIISVIVTFLSVLILLLFLRDIWSVTERRIVRNAIEKRMERMDYMAYSNECPFCGANLDPNEKCDCQEHDAEKEKVQTENKKDETK